MATANTKAPVKPEIQKTEKPTWYDFLINIFKKLLEFNYSAYGTKKKF